MAIQSKYPVQAFTGFSYVILTRHNSAEQEAQFLAMRKTTLDIERQVTCSEICPCD